LGEGGGAGRRYEVESRKEEVGGRGVSRSDEGGAAV